MVLKRSPWRTSLNLIKTFDLISIHIRFKSDSLAPTWYLSGHGEQRGDTERHAGRYGVRIEPEGDPRNDDQHAAGYVDLNQIVGELSLEDKQNFKATVFAWIHWME